MPDSKEDERLRVDSEEGMVVVDVVIKREERRE